MQKRTRFAITLTTSALLAGDFATAGANPPPASPTGDAQPAKVEAAKLAAMSRAEMKKLLATIGQAKAAEPKMGAMCYEMALPPDRAEYVCPTCGEKTLYTQAMARVVAVELETCRHYFRSLPHREAMTLDESAFCRKCRPDAQWPELTLTLRYDDGTTNVVRRVSSGDLELLDAALKGEPFIDGSGEMKSVQKQLPRLRELLGVKE